MQSTYPPDNLTATETGTISFCVEYNLFTSISRGVIGVLVFLSNLLTLLALSKAKKEIGQKGKIYVMSLSCADFLMSPMIISDLIMDKLKIYCLSVPSMDAITEDVVWKKRLGYSMKTAFGMISLGCSLASLLSISLDRLLAVSKPVFYKHNVTKFKIRCYIVILWLYLIVAILVIVMYFGRNTPPETIFFAFDGAQAMQPFDFSYVILPHIYFFILGNITFFTITIFYIRKMEAKKKQMRGESFQKTKIFMKMSGMTLLGFLILWLPYLTTNIIVDRTDPNLPLWVKDYVMFIMYSLMYSNSWINPVFYCWFNKDYRQAYKRLLKFKSGKIHNSGQHSVTM